MAGLVLNLLKCTFGHSSVDFLFHLVSSQGICSLATKVEALHCHPQPNTIKELQQFLGLLNFYKGFLPSAAKVLAPLTEALKGSPTDPTRIQWSSAILTAFNMAKNSLSTVAELSHPSPQAKRALVADASATHVGAALRPTAISDQANYSTFDRELLAAFSAVRHFRFQVEGRPFQLWMDHCPLTFAQGRHWTPRQLRQLS